MSRGNGHIGKIILPGESEPDRMTISENAETQFIEKYNSQGVPIPVIKEAVRKWNAGEDSRSLPEAMLFEVFREIQAKLFGG